MPCSGHRDGVASEQCSRCATPGCPECLEQIDGFFYCTDCLVWRLGEAESEAYDLEITTSVQNAQHEAQRRIRRIWILTGALSAVCVPAMANLVVEHKAMPAAVKLLAAPAAGIAAAYLVWAALWGMTAAWKWWKGIFEGFSALIFSSALGWLVLAVSFFVVPVYLGYLYGVLGGAIYEYRKTRRIAGGAL